MCKVFKRCLKRKLLYSLLYIEIFLRRVYYTLIYT